MNKKIAALWLASIVSAAVFANEWKPSEWPVLRHYDQNHLYHIALPLGGIGTGQVSIGGRGELRDWEIMNIPAKGFNTVVTKNSCNKPFFAIYMKPDGKAATAAILEGPLYPLELNHYGDDEEAHNYCMPRFGNASFDAAYPFGQVNLSDPDIPVSVRIKAFNPLVPADSEGSGLPVAILSYEVTNNSKAAMDVSVCGTMRNFIGRDGRNKGFAGCKQNKNVYRKSSLFKGIFFRSDGVCKADPAWGTMALTTASSTGVSYRTCSKPNRFQAAITDVWEDFSEDGILTEKAWPLEDDPMASLAVMKRIEAGQTEVFTFYLTWVFPNRKGWDFVKDPVIGNYYSTLYSDAWNAAEKIIPQIPQLEKDTRLFVNSLLESSYPDEVKEAALFNISTLRSQTVFRIPSGHLMGWEGVLDRRGSCWGSCTHVWNYEVTTPFLFGDLARTMRDVELNYATRENGCMNFRASLPLSESAKRNAPAADGQMGCVMKMYREWQLSGDQKFLADNYEQVKKVLAYAWLADNGREEVRSWDANQDGIMEGRQHNTHDVSFYGPTALVGFWYLGALRAGEEMAKAMKDKAFAKKCRELFDNGSSWIDQNLFNGEYYEQKITDPNTFEYIDMKDPSVAIPEYQVAKGCMAGQLVGQYMAHICGLGYLCDKEHIKTTLRSIMKYNWLDDFATEFNPARTFAYSGESGLVVCSWPKGKPEYPVPYYAEAWNGIEYSAAAGMIFEGMDEEGIKVFKAVRDRFDGAKRNPFSEPECGEHYARSMASWSGIIALSGFHYSGVERHMTFTDKPGKYFWSTGYAWGTCEVSSDGTAKLKVLKGDLKLDKLTIGNKTVKYKL